MDAKSIIGLSNRASTLYVDDLIRVVPGTEIGVVPTTPILDFAVRLNDADASDQMRELSPVFCRRRATTSSVD